jgi:hypothetical protein
MYHLLLLIITEIRPTMERTAIIVSGERGDCVVVRGDGGDVVGGRVETVVAGAVVCTGITLGTTLNVFTPT